MTKGTTSMGRKDKVTHIRCRRCGRHSYHRQKKRCAYCGYGNTTRMRTYNWAKIH
jgi:large subunit ribosomal protein L37e